MSVESKTHQLDVGLQRSKVKATEVRAASSPTACRRHLFSLNVYQRNIEIVSCRLTAGSTTTSRPYIVSLELFTITSL